MTVSTVDENQRPFQSRITKKFTDDGYFFIPTTKVKRVKIFQKITTFQ